MQLLARPLLFKFTLCAMLLQLGQGFKRFYRIDQGDSGLRLKTPLAPHHQPPLGLDHNEPAPNAQGGHSVAPIAAKRVERPANKVQIFELGWLRLNFLVSSYASAKIYGAVCYLLRSNRNIRLALYTEQGHR